MPETSLGCASASEYNRFAMGDRGSGSIKGDTTPGVAELTHGEERLRC